VASSSGLPAVDDWWSSAAQDRQLDAFHLLAVQDAPPVDYDFSPHPAGLPGGQLPSLGPIAVHDTHVGVSEGAGHVRLDPDGPVDLHGQEVI